MRLVSPIVLLCVGWLHSSTTAHAQALAPETPGEVGVAHTEEPDPTRLDVERLPTEAAPLSRDLFARGGYLDAHLGVIGFVGDLGEVVRPGPMLSVAGGYEFASWFALGAAFSGSMHQSHHHAPPTETSFEAVELLGHARFTVPVSVQAALWLRAEGGMFASTGDIVRALGFRQGDDVVGNVGGSLGFDWHVRARHHSFGVEAGSRWLPGLERTGFSLSVHGSVYLHYVF